MPPLPLLLLLLLDTLQVYATSLAMLLTTLVSISFFGLAPTLQVGGRGGCWARVGRGAQAAAGGSLRDAPSRLLAPCCRGMEALIRRLPPSLPLPLPPPPLTDGAGHCGRLVLGGPVLRASSRAGGRPRGSTPRKGSLGQAAMVEHAVLRCAAQGRQQCSAPQPLPPPPPSFPCSLRCPCSSGPFAHPLFCYCACCSPTVPRFPPLYVCCQMCVRYGTQKESSMRQRNRREQHRVPGGGSRSGRGSARVSAASVEHRRGSRGAGVESRAAQKGQRVTGEQERGAFWARGAGRGRQGRCYPSKAALGSCGGTRRGAAAAAAALQRAAQPRNSQPRALMRCARGCRSR